MSKDPLPLFENPTLRDQAAAFARRGKAIRYKTGRLELMREMDGDNHERLNVDVVVSRTQIRLSLWDEGSLLYQACHPGPNRSGGWEFMLTFSGHAGDIEPDELVKMFERSLDCAHEKDPDEHSREILSHWKRVNPNVDRSAG